MQLADNGPLGFRQALEADYGFLYALHVAAMKEHVERIWGWDDTVQANMYRRNFVPSEIQIITYVGAPIGMLSLEELSDVVYLRQLELLPEYQNRGIGAQIVRSILSQSHQRKKEVILRVLRGNRARDLYERLGFMTTEETTTHIHMRSLLGTEPGGTHE